jgi:hypothetical protein
MEIKVLMEIKGTLEKMIGQEASVNQSPTYRAKLISVDKFCVWEVTPNHYGDKGNECVGNTFRLPLSISGTCFWGI